MFISISLANPKTDKWCSNDFLQAHPYHPLWKFYFFEILCFKDDFIDSGFALYESSITIDLFDDI